MTRTLLDTDTLSFYMKGVPAVVARASTYLAEFSRLDFSVVTYYEVRRGLLHAGASRKLGEFESLTQASVVWELDHAAAQEAADICAELWRRGEPIDDGDILIAATARRRGLAVATGNVKHFSRVPGLAVKDWLAG